jgi:hypothetical protein
MTRYTGGHCAVLLLGVGVLAALPAVTAAGKAGGGRRAAAPLLVQQAPGNT